MKFDHLGFIVKDAKRTTKFIESVVGPVEWKIADYTFPQDCMIVGKAFKIRTYNGIIAEDWFEIIEPLEGEGSYFMNYVQNSPGGFHHIAYSFPDTESCDKKVQEMQDQGYVIVHASERVPGHKTYYMSLPERSPSIEFKV